MSRITVSIELDAPPDRVWQVLEPIERHVDWMADAVAIRFVGEQTSGVGTRFVCDTKVGPFTLTDRMEITEWDPGRSMGVRHSGIVTGSGVFTLEPIDLGRRTRFTWEEDLRFPWYVGGPIAGLIGGQVVLRMIWRRNLRALDRLIRSRSEPESFAADQPTRSAELPDRRGHGGADHDHDDQWRPAPRGQRGGRDACRAGVDHQVLAVGERVVHDERRDQRSRDQRETPFERAGSWRRPITIRPTTLNE